MSVTLNSLKESLKRTIKITALRVPQAKCQQIVKVLKPFAFSKRNIRPIRDDFEQREPKTKLYLLKPGIEKDLSGLSERAKKIINDIKEIEAIDLDLDIGYENETYHSALSQALPDNVQIPGSFETAGHIAHFNLRDDQLPFKNIIGQVLIDKQSHIKTVVNKTSAIATQFRTFPLELIAGEDKLECEVHESKCRFQFNFANVYWNSRLGREHERLVELFKPSDIIFDAMAGVGPFAIPAAKKKCQVYANDLNPESFKWLKHNIALNKVKVNTSNLDGRVFFKDIVAKLLINELKGKNSHIIMNLPASAYKFVDTFRGLFQTVEESNRSQIKLPLVHCYGFASSKQDNDFKQEFKTRVMQRLNVTQLDADVSHVRSVAPHTEMVRISFRVPDSVAYEAISSDDVALHSRAIDALEDDAHDAIDDTVEFDGDADDAAQQTNKKPRLK